MEKLKWGRKVAYHFLIREPIRSIQDLNNFAASLAAFAFFLSVILFLMYCTAYAVFYIKDLIMDPSQDLVSAQVHVSKSFNKNMGYTEYRSYTKERFLNKNRVCRSYMREADFPGSINCVAPDGVSRETLYAEKDHKITCCTLSIPRNEAPRLYYQRFENIKRWTAIFWLPLFLYLCGFGIFGVVCALLGWSFVIAVVPYTFFSSIVRGVRNTYLSFRLPKLIPLMRREMIDGRPFIVQLSDLHLTAADKNPIELNALSKKWPSALGTPNGSFLAERASSALKTACLIDPELIILTGDITDNGLHVEWQQFDAVCNSSEYYLRGHRVAMIAGNHDINFNLPERPDSDLWNMVYRSSRFESAHKKLTQKFGEALNYRDGVGVQTISVEHNATSHFNIIALDTNKYKSRNAFSGAIGLIGQEQLSTVQIVIANLSGPLVVAMHHHFGVPAGLPNGVEDIWLVTIDANALLQTLEAYAAASPKNKVLIIHGHRHRLYYSTTKKQDIMIFGLGSSTMGTEDRIQASDGSNSVKLDGVGSVAVIGMSAHGEWSVFVQPADKSL